MQPFTEPRPFARLQPATPAAFKFKGGFWGPRRQQLSQVVLPSQFKQLTETGRLENFYRAAGKSTADFKGFYFNDSDVYKWLEAASWTLLFDPDPRLQAEIDTAIAAIEAAQQPDGYLDTYFMFEKASQRWTNLQDWHELYCAGHLFEAAAAHQQAANSDRLVTVARRLADHIVSTFGPQGRPGAPGHPEVELALVKLYESSGNVDYLQLAQSFINNRGKGLIGGRPYHQDHVPFREMDRLVGHAVRALYLCSGAADIYQFTGEQAMRAALERLWQHMLSRQIYISGGVGSRHEGEAFGDDYELPNDRAYTETCAAIASLLWNQRMLQIDGMPGYADLMEWTLYNAVLPGISLDGRSYFYVNPLSNDGSHRRREWYDCACCPPNIARVLASLPSFFFSQSSAAENGSPTFWLHSYAQGELGVQLPDGQHLSLSLSGEYPWQGSITVAVQGLQHSAAFTLALRIPGWCLEKPPLWLNGMQIDCETSPGSYLQLNRTWQPGDELRLELPMSIRLLASHPYALENTGRVSLARGPILYCLEAADHPGIDLSQVVLPPNGPISEQFHPDLLGGVFTLQAPAQVVRLPSTWEDRLYQPFQPEHAHKEPLHIQAIPYFAWANRQPGQMQTWLKVG